MLCQEFSLVKHGLRGVRCVSLFCNAWNCEVCAPRRARKIAGQLKHGHPNKFLTLTVDANRGIDAEQRARSLLRAFQAWVKQLRKLHPDQKIEYGYVFEKTQNGEPHLHVLGRWPFTSQAKISSFMRAHIGAPVVWIEAVKSKRKAAAYVSKYLSKDCTKFGTMKRYGFSKGYRAPRTDRKIDPPEWRSPWQKVERSWHDLVTHYIVQGWKFQEDTRRGYFEALRPEVSP